MKKLLCSLLAVTMLCMSGIAIYAFEVPMPTSYEIYTFTSRNVFISAFESDFEKEFAEYEWYITGTRESFINFISKLDSINIPTKTGYIEVMTADSIFGDNPQINFSVSGMNIYCTLLDEETVAEFEKAQSVNEFITKLAPYAPTPGNIPELQSFKHNYYGVLYGDGSGYSRITNASNIEIQLADGIERPAVIWDGYHDFQEQNRIVEFNSVIFVYENMLCLASPLPLSLSKIDVVDELKSVSFEKVPLNQNSKTTEPQQTEIKEPVIYGDLVGMGKPTLESVILTARYISGGAEKQPLTDAQKFAADIDGDGEVTMLDLMEIIRLVMNRD